MNEFYRFQVFVTKNLKDSVGTKSVVGAAYLRQGQHVYTLKLWMFPAIRFYLMPDKEDSSKMVIFTREPKKDQNIGKGKFFWNLIGQGHVDPSREVIRLQFDLIEKPIYMSIFPVNSRESGSNEPSELMDAS